MPFDKQVFCNSTCFSSISVQELLINVDVLSNFVCSGAGALNLKAVVQFHITVMNSVGCCWYPVGSGESGDSKDS